jgi:hypothetical protein
MSVSSAAAIVRAIQAKPPQVVWTSEHEDEPEDDDDFLTDWELDFRASVECQDFDLTPRQQEVLGEIEQRIEDRRRLWRAGHRPPWSW